MARQVLNRSVCGMGARPSTKGASRRFVAGDGDVQRRFQDAFQLQLRIQLLSSRVLDPGQFPRIGFLEEGLDLPANLQGGNEQKVPRLHEAHRRRQVGHLQDAAQHLIRDRLGQELADVASAAHHLVDRLLAQRRLRTGADSRYHVVHGARSFAIAGEVMSQHLASWPIKLDSHARCARCKASDANSQARLQIAWKNSTETCADRQFRNLLSGVRPEHLLDHERASAPAAWANSARNAKSWLLLVLWTDSFPAANFASLPIIAASVTLSMPALAQWRRASPKNGPICTNASSGNGTMLPRQPLAAAAHRQHQFR